MALPDIYTNKPGAIPAYFDAILQAEAPERFSTKFLEGLEFRLFGGIRGLKVKAGALPQTPGFSEAWLRCPMG